MWQEEVLNGGEAELELDMALVALMNKAEIDSQEDNVTKFWCNNDQSVRYLLHFYPGLLARSYFNLSVELNETSKDRPNWKRVFGAEFVKEAGKMFILTDCFIFSLSQDRGRRPYFHWIKTKNRVIPGWVGVNEIGTTTDQTGPQGYDFEELTQMIVNIDFETMAEELVNNALTGTFLKPKLTVKY